VSNPSSPDCEVFRFLKHICWFLLSLLVILAGCNDRQTPNENSQADPRNKIEKSAWPEKYEPVDVSMELKQVSEHVYFVEGPPGTGTENNGFMSNAGVIITSKGIVIFDSLGTPSLAYKLYSLIRKISDLPVAKVVVSHYHADHIYGLQVFKEMGAEILAPEGADEYLLSEAAEGRLRERRESLFPWVDENTYIVKPDIYISTDTRFEVGDVRFDMLLLGSTHSEGDLMLRVQPDGVLFSGDLIFEGRIPLVAGSSPDHWLERLQTLDTDSIRIIVPGHGDMSSDPKQAVRFTQTYLSDLHDGMATAVENLMSFDEAYQSMDWTKYSKLPASEANRINAYYVFLKLEAMSVQ